MMKKVSILLLLLFTVVYGAVLQSKTRYGSRSSSIKGRRAFPRRKYSWSRNEDEKDEEKPKYRGLRTNNEEGLSKMTKLNENMSFNAEKVSSSISDNYEKDEFDGIFEPIKVICEINGYLVPAVIDTGAQISIMSYSCMKRCRITSGLDSRFAGRAVGVGSVDILGRIDDLEMRIGPLSFKSKISVLRESGAEFLLGLDFLRRFRANINMAQNVMTIQVRDKVLKIPLGVGSTIDMNLDQTGIPVMNLSTEDAANFDFPLAPQSYECDMMSEEAPEMGERVSMEGI
jgi:hypothetical protein